MTKTRKTTMNIEAALADPHTVYGVQHGDETCKVKPVRRTRTGRPVVTFDDGTEARYTGREEVIVVREITGDGFLGKGTHTGPVRGWNRY